MVDNIARANMLFYPLYYDIISLTSLKITQVFHLLLGFTENQAIYWDFKIRNSIRITEGSDNRDSDNRGSTVQCFAMYQLKLAMVISCLAGVCSCDFPIQL